MVWLVKIACKDFYPSACEVMVTSIETIFMTRKLIIVITQGVSVLVGQDSVNVRSNILSVIVLNTISKPSTVIVVIVFYHLY